MPLNWRAVRSVVGVNCVISLFKKSQPPCGPLVATLQETLLLSFPFSSLSFSLSRTRTSAEGNTLLGFKRERERERCWTCGISDRVIQRGIEYQQRNFFPRLVFGCLFQIFADLRSGKEFESRLERLLQDLQVDCIPITTSNTTWDIPVNEYGQFNVPAPNKVFAAIELELYDYVFISMPPNMEVRIVVFSGTDDAERIYDWFADD
ncbi:hypothetical protein RHMOL_Rhmol11G0166800 [Rhododendron molle]|uniref:Uncharacterized protein n=2 Tax=Rhododendron molle TaxID=49168 RepID=A0ACC0LSZ7_RHOML|nr:hypothetical protein RHMOL_Rhmol11G0166800 [Rhododendron molle]KAI8531835.1 hypothetical protein RHMOL_Rhmol11G0166800 [Rhododendron molle]